MSLLWNYCNKSVIWYMSTCKPNCTTPCAAEILEIIAVFLHLTTTPNQNIEVLCNNADLNNKLTPSGTEATTTIGNTCFWWAPGTGNKDIYMTCYVLSLDRSAVQRNFQSTLHVSAWYRTTDDTYILVWLLTGQHIPYSDWATFWKTNRSRLDSLHGKDSFLFSKLPKLTVEPTLPLI